MTGADDSRIAGLTADLAEQAAQVVTGLRDQVDEGLYDALDAERGRAVRGRRRRPRYEGPKYTREQRFGLAEVGTDYSLTATQQNVLGYFVKSVDFARLDWTGQLGDIAAFTKYTETPIRKAIEVLAEVGLLVIIKPFVRNGTAACAMPAEVWDRLTVSFEKELARRDPVAEKALVISAHQTRNRGYDQPERQLLFKVLRGSDVGSNPLECDRPRRLTQPLPIVATTPRRQAWGGMLSPPHPRATENRAAILRPCAVPTNSSNRPVRPPILPPLRHLRRLICR
jgi:hypothetical protein